MTSNTFNICPICVHKDICVLTTQKNQVWSCSEYEEGAVKIKADLPSVNNKKKQPEMAVAYH
ncbi:hypothetical protein [Rasiella sp. SM2506]|uniref:hypothetical protein n=1 Tax=Rasiella sp. SM2506 TaxID=3423914 RepID=UPI003D7A2848